MSRTTLPPLITDQFVPVDRGYVTPCEEWQRATNPHGYGYVWFEGRMRLVHRLIWQAANGTTPEEVCHHCDNPPCARLDHLFDGTHSENMQDAANKRRLMHGETHLDARLTEADVRSIRASSESLSALARQYGVGLTTVWSVVHRVTRKHVA